MPKYTLISATLIATSAFAFAEDCEFFPALDPVKSKIEATRSTAIKTEATAQMCVITLHRKASKSPRHRPEIVLMCVVLRAGTQ